MAQSQDDGGVSGESTLETMPLLSHDTWETLEKQLSRDSELRLLIVVMRVSVIDAPFNREPTKQVLTKDWWVGGTCSAPT